MATRKNTNADVSDTDGATEDVAQVTPGFEEPEIKQVDGVDVAGDGPLGAIITADTENEFGTWTSPDETREVTAYSAAEAVQYQFDGWTRK